MIHITHLTKLYGSVIGVNDVSVTLAGGAHGLLGPNGAGKTTLLGLVTGQLRPTIGGVRVFGERPFSNPRVLARIGYCPSGDLTERTATPREWVRYLMRLSGFDPAAATRRADRALERVGLTAAATRPLGTLSKGMRQRAKLAGAFAHDPDLLVLDEPFDGLDPVARHELVALVREWARTRSLLVASGSAAEIRGLVDRLPTDVRVGCRDPRGLAAAVVGEPFVESVRMADASTVVIGTRRPDELAMFLRDAAAVEAAGIRRIESGDRSLEGIFDRLVRLHRGAEP